MASLVFNSTDTSVDYNFEATPVRFGACERRKCVNVKIIDDDEPEYTETFTIYLEKSLASTDTFVLSSSVKVINITDNDQGTILFVTMIACVSVIFAYVTAYASLSLTLSFTCHHRIMYGWI